MCLNLINVDNRLGGDFWKVLEKVGRRVISPFHANCTWERGVNVSDRPQSALDDFERRLGVVQQGFHVFLSAREAMAMALDRHNFGAVGDLLVCRMTGLKEDFVASGWWQRNGHMVDAAVFGKLDYLGPYTGND